MIPIILPYKMGSRSATALARGLNTRKVYPDRNYRVKDNHVIINWGMSSIPQVLPDEFGGVVLNHFALVGSASNKLHTFYAFDEDDVPHPEFTTSQQQAQQWIDANDGTVVVERHTLNGHSGDGIALKSFGEDISPAPLYTKYVKKAAEYRVHVFRGRVIDVQQKKKRNGVDSSDVNFQVRSHDNGWVFCRENITQPDGLSDVAIAAINSLNLDFGAVDIIYNQRHNQCYVLEVNTAPGLEGTTLEKYISAIKEYCDE